MEAEFSDSEGCFTTILSIITLGCAIAVGLFFFEAPEKNKKDPADKITTVVDAANGKTLTYYVLNGAINKIQKATVTHERDNYVYVQLHDVVLLNPNKYETVVMKGICEPYFQTHNTKYLEGIKKIDLVPSSNVGGYTLNAPLETCMELEKTIPSEN